jgi:hypothetical protein
MAREFQLVLADLFIPYPRLWNSSRRPSPWV